MSHRGGDFATWLKILAILGGVAGAVLCLICVALSLLFAEPTLMYWAAIFGTTAILLVMVVAVYS